MLAFTKAAGHDWLTVDENGVIPGRPDAMDKGVNTFLVSVTDEDGHLDAVRLRIDVVRP